MSGELFCGTKEEQLYFLLAVWVLKESESGFLDGIPNSMDESDQGGLGGGAGEEACGNIRTIVLFVNGGRAVFGRTSFLPMVNTNGHRFVFLCGKSMVKINMSDFMAKVGNGMLKVTVTLEVTVTNTIRMPATLNLTVSANTADNVRTLRAYRLLHSWDERQAIWNSTASRAEEPLPASGHLPQIRHRTVGFGGGEREAACSESSAVAALASPAGGKVEGDRRSSL